MGDFQPIEKRKLQSLEGVMPISTVKPLINPDKPMEAHITALNESYGAGDLDTEAEIIVAINATNAALNDLLGELEHYRILRSA